MAEQKTSPFDDWLFRNGIHIPPSLKEKLEAKYIASFVCYDIFVLTSHSPNSVYLYDKGGVIRIEENG